MFSQEAKPSISAEIIMQGVKSSRLQWPAAKLELDIKYISHRRILTNSVTMRVDFSDEYRVFESISPKKNKGEKNLYNGDYAITYDGDQHLEIKTLGKVGSQYLFDPRLIGITASYSAGDNIYKRIPINEGEKNLKIVGEELIQGINTTVVVFTDKHEQVVKLWVDPSSDFKVHKYSLSTQMRSNVVRNIYNNNNFTWLPTTSKVHTYDTKTGELLSERLILVKDFKINKNPEINEQMGLSLIDPKIGTQIIDTRVHKLLGVWDGNKIVGVLPLPADAQPGGKKQLY
jgi:hypothetical protein